MKSTNISSTTGRSPEAAAPAAAPMIRRLGDRRVEHAVGELAVEALGDAEHAAPGVVLAGRAGAAGDVLAEDDDGLVALHLLRERLVDRLLEA